MHTHYIYEYDTHMTMIHTRTCTHNTHESKIDAGTRHKHERDTHRNKIHARTYYKHTQCNNEHDTYIRANIYPRKQAVLLTA